MSFNNGDVVRIGKGKVEYTVFEPQTAPEGFTTVQSNNTGKVSDVETDRLTLVTAAPNAVHASEEVTLLVPQSTLSDDELDALVKHVENPNHDLSENDEFMLSIDGDGTEPEIMAPREIELLHGGTNPKRPYLLTVDGVTSDHKSYGAACDALVLAARQGIQMYAVIDHQGQRKVTRTAV